MIDDDPPAAATRPTLPRPPANGSSGGVPTVLNQIRTLGELRDAGYISDDEFERLKQKILADALDDE